MKTIQAEDRCAENLCGNEPVMNYLGKRICQNHWEEICNKKVKETKYA